MTFRAILLGLLGAVFVATAGYAVDHIAHLNRFVSGQFPIVVYGPLVIFVLLAAAAGRGRRSTRRARLHSAEWGVIIAAMLVACSIPSNGLLRYFTRCLVMPVHFQHTVASWRKDGLLDDLPAVLVANRGQHDEEVVVGFLAGLGREGRAVGLADVPWAAWTETLAFWGAILLLFAVASVCLALIVHPQWSKRERLRYPIAAFADALLDPGGAERPRPVYRRRWFWAGLATLLAVHVINGLHAWWPDTMIRVPLRFDFSGLLRRFPWLRFGWGGYRIAYPVLWPTAVALAFFLAKDVTFSVGMSQPLATVLGAALLHAGLIRAEGNFITGQPSHWQRAGSCLALAVMLLYFGRRYYAGVLRQALCIGRRDPAAAEPYAVRACRVLLLALAALVVLLVGALRLPWPFAVAFVMLTLLAYLVVARITAEFGIFYVQIIWYPVSVLLPFLGAAALGPEALVTLAVLSTVFVAQPEESAMAFVVQGLKIAEGRRLRIGRTGWVTAGAVVLALAAGIVCALWVDYSYGGARAMRWDSHGQPRLPFDVLQAAKTKLRLAGRLDQSYAMTTLQRLAAARPNPTFLWAAGLGFAAVLLTYALRLRWPWWPIHPVMFLIWETWASAAFFHSFLLAWVIQIAVGRIGTASARRSARHFMIGVIAGEMLGAMLWMGMGGAYYGLTGRNPPYYNVFPY